MFVVAVVTVVVAHPDMVECRKRHAAMSRRKDMEYMVLVVVLFGGGWRRRRCRVSTDTEGD